MSEDLDSKGIFLVGEIVSKREITTNGPKDVDNNTISELQPKNKIKESSSSFKFTTKSRASSPRQDFDIGQLFFFFLERKDEKVKNERILHS